MVIHNCGAVGRNGPSQTQCSNAYKDLPQVSDVCLRHSVFAVCEMYVGPGVPHVFLSVHPPQFITETTFVSAGIQTVTVPMAGAWRITAYGARGGYAQANSGDFVS